MSNDRFVFVDTSLDTSDKGMPVTVEAKTIQDALRLYISTHLSKVDALREDETRTFFFRHLNVRFSLETRAYQHFEVFYGDKYFADLLNFSANRDKYISLR